MFTLSVVPSRAHARPPTLSLVSAGIKESDTGLAPPSQWDLVSDKQMMQEEQPLQVARCTKIINAGTDEAQYVINIKQIAKFVVGLGDRVSPTDIEEGMRVGVDRNKYQIQIPLPPKIDPTVTMMTVEEKPDVTYSDIGGCKEQIEKMREVVEMPMLHPEKFVALGIDPPKGILCYGPPGTGKTLLARAVANRTDACFIRVIGSELVQKYVGEGARMVRELFQMARTKKACLIFFDEVDAIGGARFDDGAVRKLVDDRHVEPKHVTLLLLLLMPLLLMMMMVMIIESSGSSSWRFRALSWWRILLVRSTDVGVRVPNEYWDNRVATTRCRGRCLRLSISWTVSIRVATSRSSWRRTDQTLWTPPSCARAAWTGRWNLAFRTWRAAHRSLRSTAVR